MQIPWQQRCMYQIREVWLDCLQSIKEVSLTSLKRFCWEQIFCMGRRRSASAEDFKVQRSLEISKILVGLSVYGSSAWIHHFRPVPAVRRIFEGCSHCCSERPAIIVVHCLLRCLEHCKKIVGSINTFETRVCSILWQSIWKKLSSCLPKMFCKVIGYCWDFNQSVPFSFGGSAGAAAACTNHR